MFAKSIDGIDVEEIQEFLEESIRGLGSPNALDRCLACQVWSVLYR